ncbi:hypothetical protein Taro_006753 [Colocasia esculenta]|uniref:Uncharacterized protein n=1 Tax=Colocasia esculenta TaxID=4460 RepID=A0A843TXW1_COLES|nr:hypothetical protein [Colocasia esculenta]
MPPRALSGKPTAYSTKCRCGDRTSVLYVNFGSITVFTAQQLVEFALGLADSGQPFLWVIRPDLVAAVLPESVFEETAGRGFLTSWCPQEEVLANPSIGGFLTHGGWNSMPESIRYAGLSSRSS